ncbi:transcriptional regulator, TetR family [Nocardia amikacinitolerans]|uniref:Transcriptional regulator, TetR family n=1 Tax=Nocardia amikacinitolerans TaxID=756689 RepID=A0A285LVA2_9NOCA|nr:TetR/AcrR family transcriptional regulator [Nocardia amikacinitolerans]MCP2278160.1 transcriptional regulator, TetR family [Nocardia amikacinitolerans]MCP2294579.1 transcriptional regulator, TetR family [Nocardia amikacinitolerans]SNY88830.1 transcriptional regulator, TetR family [Nocardia amikacinitolerans]
MRTNPERRQALIDAAIEVLADEGARGLTFRAVDKRAGVPAGTASNYFANRDDLLTQVGSRFYERLQPSDETMAKVTDGPRTRANITELMKDIVARIEAFRTGYLAMLELRLEATRRPELRAVLTERVREDLDFNVRTHLESGQPGDADAVRLLYLALNWLIVDRMTLPDIFSEEQSMHLIETAVERLVRD